MLPASSCFVHDVKTIGDRPRDSAVDMTRLEEMKSAPVPDRDRWLKVPTQRIIEPSIQVIQDDFRRDFDVVLNQCSTVTVQ